MLCLPPSVWRPPHSKCPRGPNVTLSGLQSLEGARALFAYAVVLVFWILQALSSSWTRLVDSTMA
jgi:hypothetical protein